MEKDKKPRYALVVTAQVARISESYLSNGDQAHPLLGKFTQSYQMGEDTADTNGRVRSRLGEDVTYLLQRLTDEHKWRYPENETDDGRVGPTNGSSDRADVASS